MYVVVSVFNFAIFFLFFNPIFPEFLNAFDDSVTYVHGFTFVIHLFSLVSSFVEAAEGVSDNFAFDVLVDRTVGVEGWGVIDFDKDGREILLEHYVEAEDGEAHVVFDVVGLAGALHVRHGGGGRDQGLDDDGFDIPFELLLVFIFAFEVVPEPLQMSLVPLAHLSVVF